jgi:hypothetical protein
MRKQTSEEMGLPIRRDRSFHSATLMHLLRPSISILEAVDAPERAT